jgi:tetratricopeptide (TPR) repeat protein
MLSVRRVVPALAVVVVAAACATTGTGTNAPAPGRARMVIPITTQSPVALDEFLQGVHDLDVERPVTAREHFDRALAADPNFALGHLYAAFAAPSLATYRKHLEEAVRLADRASPAEQLWIRAERLALDNDLNNQGAFAQQLVQLTPNDPRAFAYLAGVQFNAGNRADARASLDRATQLDPNSAPGWILIGNSYLQTEPRDLAKAETYVRRAVSLAPNEPYTHDYMGDVFRAVNNLPQARAEYTRMIELDPARAGAYQQRGHVNSFLGNFAEARADYDRAVQLADPGTKPTFAVYRALVNVYSGDPAAAEAELERIAASVDAMNIPNADGAKIFALTEEARIALHNRHLDVAQRAIDQLKPVYRQQAEMGGSDAIKRTNEAQIDYWEGMLAARRGDFATARNEVRDMMQQVAPNKNPRKNEGAHELLGMTDLLEGNYASAVGHFAQANPDDIYVWYNQALALDAAGRKVEARDLFRRVAAWNFNNASAALVKGDAARRAM